ncbi:MAG: BNR-4 repeat-containing protein, partial [Candidatus Kariarchaeaceae archaeon]
MKAKIKRMMIGLTFLILIITMISSPINFENNFRHDNKVFARTTDSENTKNIQVPLAEGVDDDYWTNKDGSWSHQTNYVYVRCNHYIDRGIEYGQFRFQLWIPQAVTIQYASISVWEVQDNVEFDAIIRRINETNVGSLENDTSLPQTTDLHSSIHEFDRTNSEWRTSVITDLVQDQVNLTDWQPGYYFGVQFSLTGYDGGDNLFEAYEHANNREAFLNITYSENVNWLNGWRYRRNIFLPINDNAGSNYSIPMTIFSGYGVNQDNKIYLEDKSKSDFADIRFTDHSGNQLLNHWLQASIDETQVPFYTNSSVRFAAYTYCYPNSFFFNNRTYIVFQGDLDENEYYVDPHIIYYNHQNSLWSKIHRIAENPLGDRDDHGAPAMWIDNDRYIHVLFGSHSTPMEHWKSEKPENITGWVQMPVIGNYATYPHIYYDNIGDVVHLYFREIINSDLVVRYANSTDNGNTWNYQTIINMYTDDPTPYNIIPYFEVGQLDPNNRELLHIVWKKFNVSGVGTYEDVYYAKLNVTSGTMYNVSNHDLGTTITYGEETSCYVYDSNTAFCSNEIVRVDENSFPYILWAVNNNTGGNWATIKFRYWTGSTWTNVIDVSAVDRVATSTAFTLHDSNNITAFLGDDGD